MTELTVAGVGGGQPLLPAALVHFTQRASAVAGREQRLSSSSLVTDPTHTHITVQRHRQAEGSNDVMIKQCTIKLELNHWAPSEFLLLLTLQAHSFDNSGEWAAIFSRNLGNVLGLGCRIRLLRILGGV